MAWKELRIQHFSIRYLYKSWCWYMHLSGSFFYMLYIWHFMHHKCDSIFDIFMHTKLYFSRFSSLFREYGMWKKKEDIDRPKFTEMHQRSMHNSSNTQSNTLTPKNIAPGSTADWRASTEFQTGKHHKESWKWEMRNYSVWHLIWIRTVITNVIISVRSFGSIELKLKSSHSKGGSISLIPSSFEYF